MKNFLLVISMLALCATVQAKTARCVISNHGKPPFLNTKCDFSASKDGSFSLSNLNPNKALFGDVLMVNVAIIDKNFAQVRGLTREGINSRWGEYYRSQEDKACWIDDSSKICAYKLK